MSASELSEGVFTEGRLKASSTKWEKAAIKKDGMRVW